MDPVANFLMRMDQEDRMVDHLKMKIWEEKLERAKSREEKLVECLVTMTGCSKKSAHDYAGPGYHELPNNVKLKEAREERDHYRKKYESKAVENKKLMSLCHYLQDIEGYLFGIAETSDNWTNEGYEKAQKELKKKYEVDE